VSRGQAWSPGRPGSLTADTAYGPALVATIVASLLLLLVGAILVGSAIARSAPALRWVGIGYAVSLAIFSFSGVLGFGAGIQPPPVCSWRPRPWCWLAACRGWGPLRTPTDAGAPGPPCRLPVLRGPRFTTPDNLHDESPTVGDRGAFDRGATGGYIRPTR
jgi:hypothetical protein